MARQWTTPDGSVISEVGERQWTTPEGAVVSEAIVAPPTGGRIMSSLAASGGLAYKGGVAGQGGGLAG